MMVLGLPLLVAKGIMGGKMEVNKKEWHRNHCSIGSKM